MISDYTALSKEISYALRHAPQEYGLRLDEQGWVLVESLINTLKKREKYSDLTVQDIANMIQDSEKKRYERGKGNRQGTRYVGIPINAIARKPGH